MFRVLVTRGGEEVNLVIGYTIGEGVVMRVYLKLMCECCSAGSV